MNPFKYGYPVKGDYFLNRPKLKASTLGFLDNQINTVLVGPRRFGKTSFILDLLAAMEKESYTTVYVDVFNVTSHRDFLQQFLDALCRKQNAIIKLKDWLLSFSKKIRPELTFNLESFRFSLSENRVSNENVKQLIMDAFEKLELLGKKICIAFDEFQTVGSLDDNGWLEATIRSKMQLSKNVSFLFSGSRHGMIHEMFNSRSRPFFRSCQMIDFPSLGEDFIPWLIHKFKLVSLEINPKIIKYLSNLVDDTPHYIQMVCFHIVANGYKIVTESTIDIVLQQIVHQNAYAYQTLLNTLTPIQQRVLRMVAIEQKGFFAKEKLEKYEIQTGAHVSQAINSLSGKQILESGPQRGEIYFDDPLFAIWLRFEFKK